MAKSSALVKTKTELKAGEITVPDVKSNKKTASVLKLVDTAIAGAKTFAQSANQLEAAISKAVAACLQHQVDHGDAMPADRLIKGLLLVNHPSVDALAAEAVAWFKLHSNIRWDAKRKLSVLKKGDEGFNEEVKPEEAAKQGINETPAAIRRRSAERLNTANTMKDADSTMFVNRIMGQIKWFSGMLEGKDDRKIKTGEEAKMKRIAKAVQAALVDVAGKDAVTAATAKKD